MQMYRRNVLYHVQGFHESGKNQIKKSFRQIREFWRNLPPSGNFEPTQK